MVSSINGINNNININIKASQTKTEQSEFDSLLRQAQNETDEEKLKETCRNLESVFVNIMFKQMQSTVQKTGLVDGGTAEDIFTDMLTEQYSEEASQGEGLGIAQVLFKQLSKNIK